MPSAPSRIAASKLASVFSGNRAEACETSLPDAQICQSWALYPPPDDPNNLLRQNREQSTGNDDTDLGRRTRKPTSGRLNNTPIRGHDVEGVAAINLEQKKQRYHPKMGSPADNL